MIKTRNEYDTLLATSVWPLPTFDLGAHLVPCGPHFPASNSPQSLGVPQMS